MQTKYQTGLELFNFLHGEHSGTEIVSAFKDLCPKLAEITIETVFGDILQNKALDLKTRELALIASIMALGHSLPQVVSHTEAALVAGATPDEIIQVMLQTAIIAGFPATVNAMIAVKPILAPLIKKEPL